MSDLKPIFTGREEWKGRFYVSELYGPADVSKISPITQVQAVCFIDDKHIVLNQYAYGWLGLPGGHIKKNETAEEVLRRELLEEIAAELKTSGVLGYEKIWYEDKPKEISYFLRCWAKVKLLDQKVSDPDGKSLGRVVLPINGALQKQGYGKKEKY